MSAGATINDFLDLIRFEADDGVKDLGREALAIKARASSKGRLQSGATLTELIDAGEVAYRALVDVTLDKMRQLSTPGDLDPADVRDMAFQHLLQLIEVVRGALGLEAVGIRTGAVDAAVERRFDEFKKYLDLKSRQYAIGWAGYAAPRAAEPVASGTGGSPQTPTSAEEHTLSAPPEKTVFISYSWDSEDHKKWVRELAERLVANGVHALLDQWDVRYGDSLTQFMDERIPTADFVLVIATPAYAQKATRRQGGVGYEAQIMSAHVASGVERTKFVPIIRSGSLSPIEENCAVPPHFQGIMSIDMRNDGEFLAMFEGLLRHIYGQPLLARPALGPKPTFGRDEGNQEEVPEPVRLANFEVEGWELRSGVASHELAPDTFHIPDEASRRAVAPGDFVMVQFIYAFEEGGPDDGASGERMWLEVEGFSGPYLIGSLRNPPAVAEHYHHLDWGDRIVFLPEHVIAIDERGEGARRAWAAQDEQGEKE